MLVWQIRNVLAGLLHTRISGSDQDRTVTDNTHTQTNTQDTPISMEMAENVHPRTSSEHPAICQE